MAHAGRQNTTISAMWDGEINAGGTNLTVTSVSADGKRTRTEVLKERNIQLMYVGIDGHKEVE